MKYEYTWLQWNDEPIEKMLCACEPYEPTIIHQEKILYMSHFSYACKTEGENGISRLISETT